MQNCLGIDFGGVIVVNSASRSHHDTTLKSGNGMQVAQPGVMQAIEQLVQRLDGRVWIISKAGPRMQERTLQWLRDVHFCEQTGLDASHVRFCREREEKAPICHELGITHYVDDRIHIMHILRAEVRNLYLFVSAERTSQCPAWATPLADWKDGARQLFSDLET